MKTRRMEKKRRGGAAVEMAIVAPLLLTLLFGIIEFGYAFTVRQGLCTAAREGARVASLPGSSNSEVQSRVDEYLEPLGLYGYQTSLTRATADNPVETVSISIPYSNVSLLGGYFGSTNFNLSSTCSMRKEGTQ